MVFFGINVMMSCVSIRFVAGVNFYSFGVVMFLAVYSNGRLDSSKPVIDPIDVSGLSDSQIHNREVRLLKDLMFVYGYGDTQEEVEDAVSIVLVEDPYNREV